MVNICTTIEQSKHLLELGLNPETADMYIFNLVAPNGKIDGTNVRYIFKEELNPFVNVEPENIIPSWSLSAMLSVLPFHIIVNNQRYAFSMHKGLNKDGETYMFRYNIFNTDICLYSTEYYNNSIDACYEMIIKLHELNLL